MIEDLDADGVSSEDEVARELAVAERGRGVAAGVVVAEDEGGGVPQQSGAEDLAGVNGRAVTVADAVELDVEDLVLHVHVKDDEGFAVGGSDLGPDEVGGLGRGHYHRRAGDGRGALGDTEGEGKRTRRARPLNCPGFRGSGSRKRGLVHGTI